MDMLLKFLIGKQAFSRKIIRIRKQVFLNMHIHFHNKSWSQNSHFISIKEKVAMFLMTKGQYHNNCVVKKRYSHWTYLAHGYFYELPQSMLHFLKRLLSQIGMEIIEQVNHNIIDFYK